MLRLARWLKSLFRTKPKPELPTNETVVSIAAWRQAKQRRGEGQLKTLQKTFAEFEPSEKAKPDPKKLH